VSSLHDPAYIRFLERLREARRHAGISQEELASRLGRHQTYVSKIEKAERYLDVVEYLRWAREIGEGDLLLLLRPLADDVKAQKRVRRRVAPNTEGR
jgi:transcriptional regulator with XRE-family HTH domain